MTTPLHQKDDPIASVSTQTLMQGKNELIILHNNQHYTLRITRNGKLILTK